MMCKPAHYLSRAIAVAFVVWFVALQLACINSETHLFEDAFFRASKGAPNARARSGVEVYWPPTTDAGVAFGVTPAQVAAEVDCIHAYAFEACSPEKRPALDDAWRSMVVIYQPPTQPDGRHFLCHGYAVTGCFTEGRYAIVSRPDLLPDETLHLFSAVCWGNTGESWDIDGGDNYSAEYARLTGEAREKCIPQEAR